MPENAEKPQHLHRLQHHSSALNVPELAALGLDLSAILGPTNDDCTTIDIIG